MNTSLTTRLRGVALGAFIAIPLLHPTGMRANPVVAATIDTAAVDPVAATREVFATISSDEPGCTVAVSREGDVVFAEAYGAARLDPLTPMTTDTIVDIGSTSKQFTATAVLLLADEGHLELDASLATYLPHLPNWASQPTLRQLMHHESGIPDYVPLLVARGFEPTGVSTTADALDALADVERLRFDPGTSWQYSNSNYLLLAEVVHVVTGDDLGAFLAAEVFTPLELDMVMDPVTVFERKAVSYQGSGNSWQVADSRWEQLGDGAVQTTPSDLVRWATQYWNSTIGPASINDQRLDGAAEVNGGRYGAGIFEFDVDGIGRVLTHGGSWAGFETLFDVAPAQHVAVAATCTSSSAARTLTGDFDLLSLWATN